MDWRSPEAADAASQVTQFRVVPPIAELGPRASAEFHVSFTPSTDNHMDQHQLECLVFPKHQRCYRLVDENRLTPPAMVSVTPTPATHLGMEGAGNAAPGSSRGKAPIESQPLFQSF